MLTHGVNLLTKNQAQNLYRTAVVKDPAIPPKVRIAAQLQIVQMVQASGTQLALVDINTFNWRVQRAFKELTGI